MMVMLKNRLYKCCVGVLSGCLICFLTVGCGGKADSPEKDKPTQEIVRQKIPATEQKPAAADAKKQKKPPKPDTAAKAKQPVEKAKAAPGTQAEGKQASVPVGQESLKVEKNVATAQETEPSAEPSKDLSAEKKAEIDAITRDAEKAIKTTAAVSGQPEGEASTTQEASHAGADAGTAKEVAEKTDEAPVIDLGAKEKGDDTGIEGEAEEEPEADTLFNPFTPLFQKEDTGVAVTELPSFRERREFLTPLEKIDIGQLTLKGIIQAQSGNRAIVTDASGEGYVIKKGTYVGLNSGTVEKIESDRVVIVESIGTRQSQTVLKLQKPAGE